MQHWVYFASTNLLLNYIYELNFLPSLTNPFHLHSLSEPSVWLTR